MANNKSISSKISGRINRYKWELMGALNLNNLEINRTLRPCNESEMQDLEIEIKTLDLSSENYYNFLNSPILNKYKKINYPHSKPLEYLSTMTLLDLQGGDKILDAAGGTEGEYIKAIMAVSEHKLTAYCQDSLLDGKTDNGITYIGGSIDAIPLPDESVDGISCHHSFEHFRDDLDIKFIQEAVRLLRVGRKLVIAPIFITNEYAEIWNIKDIQKFDPEKAITICDRTASFAGWGAYEGFARTYSPTVLKTRIINNLPQNCQAEIYQILLDRQSVPDIKKNHHQPLLNGEMKALVITKTH
ncbi:class I SAM-dependent methyltransferase [Nodularia sphaerocarpa]|uniref:class I SAM-dependent methyltransferase n=1 Tax=Nodularia sphaerocarpa TaxID=137816 RepID=UPI001EFB5A0E|nr:methyltransferase domain-containing protein [Nodularia sphaerocarpa]MDB9374859.1 methyltransferase domain-containing protein [Nodularia sphaerocarpa CS-585]MDB9378879.1 methyltransferase domain-containing protein [Nodularia sphaerocarpa CS-585A2]ULP70478.1 hypothetical protein BDGGKGIB_00094 [Nodularia sphaerocarpa UHCC 0038]